jgi:hypothetical protein
MELYGNSQAALLQVVPLMFKRLAYKLAALPLQPTAGGCAVMHGIRRSPRVAPESPVGVVRVLTMCASGKRLVWLRYWALLLIGFSIAARRS